jgi:PKD repeat protein
MWTWNNIANGSPVTQLSYADPGDQIFLLDGTNVFWTPKSDYTPLVYPHPLTQQSVRPLNRFPVAMATATPRSGPAPLIVSFSTRGSYDPEGVALTYFWSFGDGTTAAAANPRHDFTTNGVYKVQLFISDGWNTTSTNLTISAPQ